jgi:N-acyl-D-aspartate/D-glutamate deacylase
MHDLVIRSGTIVDGTGAPRRSGAWAGAEGYRATIVAGEVTFADGQPTGALPGKLVRARS